MAVDRTDIETGRLLSAVVTWPEAQLTEHESRRKRSLGGPNLDSHQCRGRETPPRAPIRGGGFPLGTGLSRPRDASSRYSRLSGKEASDGRSNATRSNASLGLSGKFRRNVDQCARKCLTENGALRPGQVEAMGRPVWEQGARFRHKVSWVVRREKLQECQNGCCIVKSSSAT
jgi:hypothetical protein